MMKHEDITALLYVENLIDDEDSPTTTRGKGKWDEVYPSGDETIEMTTTRLHREEKKNIQISLHKSILDCHSRPLTSEVMSASSSSVPAGVTLTQSLHLPILEPIVADDTLEAAESQNVQHA
ncbi:hypothetical protein K7X08_015040 [Anisodus acutangulus]|uniref:Uncharacterized protein n=1 Tax=Anisodus acutangulus TaxID=402998 RepID=A0A9Q1L3Q9_9SOLA|nr:hypothetical protein K7X08_015040 [Anisodus acutangulus]